VAKQNLKDLKEAFCPEPDLTGVIAGCAAAAVLLLMIFLSVILFLYLVSKLTEQMLTLCISFKLCSVQNHWRLLRIYC